MQVSFTYSQEDLVDATVRFALRSRALQSVRRRQLFWSAVLLVALVVLVIKFSIMLAITTGIAALIVIIFHPFLYDRRYRKTLRAWLKEKLGEENEFTCQVELLPEGMRCSGADAMSLTKWEDIEEIVPTSDSVDIFGRKGSGCIVRNRAFATAEERRRFIETATGYMNQASAQK
jgi:YcxB-like protein